MNASMQVLDIAIGGLMIVGWIATAVMAGAAAAMCFTAALSAIEM